MASEVVRYKPGILRRFHWNPLAVYAAIMFMFLLAPGLVVIILSFSSSTFMEFPPPGFSLRWYGTFFKDEQLVTALGISLEIAFASTILSILIGTLAAFSLSRYTMRGGMAIRLAMLAPFIVPWIVQATGLYRLFSLLGIQGTIGSIIIAHTVISIPFVLLVVSAGLIAVPRSLEDAARTLGATGITTARRITLPLISSSIAAAAIFAFITSFDEFILAFFLASPKAETFPIKMFLALRDKVDPRLTAVSTLFISANFALVILFERLRKSK